MDYLILVMSVSALLTVIVFYIIHRYSGSDDMPGTVGMYRVSTEGGNLPETHYNVYGVEIDGEDVWWAMRTHLDLSDYYPIPDGLIVSDIDPTKVVEQIDVMVDRHGLNNDLSFAGQVIDRAVFRWYKNPTVFYEVLGVDKKEWGCDKRTIRT